VNSVSVERLPTLQYTTGTRTTAAHVSFAAEYIVVIPLSFPEISRRERFPQQKGYYFTHRCLPCSPTAVCSARVSKTSSHYTSLKWVCVLRGLMFSEGCRLVHTYLRSKQTHLHLQGQTNLLLGEITYQLKVQVSCYVTPYQMEYSNHRFAGMLTLFMLLIMRLSSSWETEGNWWYFQITFTLKYVGDMPCTPNSIPIESLSCDAQTYSSSMLPATPFHLLSHFTDQAG
jgi:hypothetical protein